MAKYFLLALFALFISCNTKSKSVDSEKGISEQSSISSDTGKVIDFEANATRSFGKNIQCIFEDADGYFWFGTQNQGVYRYDPSVSFKKGGKPLSLLGEKDGLANNQVQTIQQDKKGNIWFGAGNFGVSRIDGKTFSTLTVNKTIPSNAEWNKEQEDLWFNAGNGVYRYSGNSLSYLPLVKDDITSMSTQNQSDRLGPYTVYSTLKDNSGNLWCGTQAMGVCRITPSNTNEAIITWFDQEGLAGPAVLALFQDKNGMLWFGNNGSGLFHFDPSTNVLTNFTKEKGLANDEFRKSGKQGPGTMARIYSINEDNSGNLWIGTADAGAWRYDGNQLKNYTTKDGLPSNAVSTIYKDKKGELWFGTETDVCKFNGTTFTTFVID